ncbi:MAG: hypothetical protein IT204_14840 [Fimbriimonadaceae bacterium]|nr:hypothetical protein [Fimbriimonadaceae bacterium]
MATASATLRAGIARRDITTTDPAVHVHDRLYATALVLETDAAPLVIVGMDVVAIGGICDVPDDFLAALRARLAGELGLDPARLLVNASHTHPAGKLLVEPPEQVELTFQAIREAWQQRVPARLGWGCGHEDRIQINRTLRLRDGRQHTIRQAYPCPPDEQVAALGPLDARIGLLRVDQLDGRPLALLFQFACHPLLGVPGGGVTANYPGFAREVIEQQLPGTLALFIQGAGGDVTEVTYKDNHRPRDSRPLGYLLGLSALTAARTIVTSPNVTLAHAVEDLRLPRRTDSAARVQARLDEQAALLASLRFTSLNFRSFLPLYLQYALNPEQPADYGYRYLHDAAREARDHVALDDFNRAQISKYLHNLGVMEQLAKIEDDVATFRRHQAINAASGEDTAAAEVLGLRIGDGALISAPIEILTEVGLNVTRAAPLPHTYVAAFSNGYLHYGAPAADYDGGGYEVTECLLAPAWQALYEAAAGRILEGLGGSAP